MKTLWTAIWRIGLFFLLWGVLFAALVAPVTRYFGQPESIRIVTLRLYVETSFLVTVIAACWVVMRYVEHRPLSRVGFLSHSPIRDLILGFSIGACMLLLTVASLYPWLSAPVWPSPSIVLLPLATGGLALLINAAAQEALVRGYPYWFLHARAGVVVASIVTSLVFALLHFSAAQDYPLALVNLVAHGVIYAYARWTSGSLWLPTGIHFAWNFVLGPVLGLSVSSNDLSSGWQILELSGPAIFTGGDYGIEAGVGATLMSALGLLVIYLLHRRGIIRDEIQGQVLQYHIRRD